MPDNTSTIGAHPAKRFFVDMLTRDIELLDAILDLLDNCLDGAVSGEISPGDRPYEGYKAEISFSADHFEISDNCNGISREIAESHAFRMGRPPAGDAAANGRTIGMYGIGMKRALFKMGESSTVTTKHDNDCYRVDITPDWLKDDSAWDLPLTTLSPDDRDETGTTIRIENLKAGIRRVFDSNEAFKSNLVSMVSTHYAFLIEKGFSVEINGDPVEPEINIFEFDNAFEEQDEAIAPYLYQTEIDGVEVKLAVGFYRALPNEDETEESLEGGEGYKSAKAGWTIVANDRVVLHADKSRVTGWGEAGVPSYHTQFIAIAGIVFFNSNEPKKLPLTTTKRGIDGNSELYLTIKEQMREGLKVFTNYTNRLKKQGTKPSDYSQLENMQSLPSNKIFERFQSVKWKPVRSTAGEKFSPDLPTIEGARQNFRIQFLKPQEEISTVAEYLGISDQKPGAIGEQAFDYVLHEAKE